MELRLRDTCFGIRLVDLTELELPSTMKTTFPDATDVLNFQLNIQPDEGERMRPCLKPLEETVSVARLPVLLS